MSSNNELKVCTFNAKCDSINSLDCCPKTNCSPKCSNDCPDSLVALAIAIQIIPTKADIYNIQNVKNRCIIDHLLKEIARVVDIMSIFNACDRCEVPQITMVDDEAVYPRERVSYFLDFASKLNDVSNLCSDAIYVKDKLECSNICGMNYVESSVLNADLTDTNNKYALEEAVSKYSGAVEYTAYYSGSCLTLVKKSLCIVPKTHEIPQIDSLVLFLEYNARKFVNVNVNLGCFTSSFEDATLKKCKVDSLVCYLKKYELCGAIIMNGAFGDFDYDTPQLFFRGDAAVPEFAQKLFANGIRPNPVPSDFPCDLSNPVYEIMDFLLRNCKAEHIPYSWLLQFLRLQNCKNCDLSKVLLHDKHKHYNNDHNNHTNIVAKKCNFTQRNNRAHLRQMKQVSDKIKSNNIYSNSNSISESKSKIIKNNSSCNTGCNTGCGTSNNNINNICYKPACISAKKCSCNINVNTNTNCDVVCKNNCVLKHKVCDCDRSQSKCEIRCKKNNECTCDDSKHKVNTNICKNLCKKKEKTKSCCDSCKHGKKCEGETSQSLNLIEDVCMDNCDGFKYCDTLSVLKRDLCLYNALNNVPDVNNRYTGFHDHFNKCNDCKYPRGIFQAWAMCQDYKHDYKHGEKSRLVDNNSELMALDHFLVSDCIRGNISCASLSELCMEKCGYDVKTLVTDKSKMDAIASQPYSFDNIFSMDTVNSDFVFQYGGSIVKSFFTHRVFCISFDFPHMAKGCNTESDETLHGLGLTGLWSILCTAGCNEVSITVFEKFGFDKHPFFKSFFWHCLRKHYCPTGNNATESDVLLSHASCIDESVICIQKRCSITEEEFYKHLLCVLSNLDSRDRFILTIAFMDAIYRVDRLRSILNDTIVDAISDQQVIDDLFMLISLCFDNRVDLARFLDNTKPVSDTTTYYINVLKEINIAKVAALITNLSPLLSENCLFMEVLIRNAVCIVKIITDVNGSSDTSIIDILGGSAQLAQLLAKVRCGYDPKQLLAAYLDTLTPVEKVALLFYILSGLDIATYIV